MIKKIRLFHNLYETNKNLEYYEFIKKRNKNTNRIFIVIKNKIQFRFFVRTTDPRLYNINSVMITIFYYEKNLYTKLI